jgi:hypothetical protein
MKSFLLSQATIKVLLGSLLLSCLSCSSSADTEETPADKESETPVEPPPPPEPTPIEKVLAKGSASEAFQYALGFMDETFNQSSDGTLLFAAWAGQSMQWSDVDISADETSFGKIKKDVNSERGKRMCWSGSIVQIQKVQDLNVFYGLLSTSRGALISYRAARSTGELVGNSRARFCGFVTGLFDYSNSGGGTGHAIDMVGIFKLPENL